MLTTFQDGAPFHCLQAVDWAMYADLLEDEGEQRAEEAEAARAVAESLDRGGYLFPAVIIPVRGATVVVSGEMALLPRPAEFQVLTRSFTWVRPEWLPLTTQRGFYSPPSTPWGSVKPCRYTEYLERLDYGAVWESTVRNPFFTIHSRREPPSGWVFSINASHAIQTVNALR